MKKRLLISFGCLSLIAVVICSVFVFNADESALLPVSYVEANLAYDAADLREAIGVSDYVFVGTVLEADNAHYLMVTEEFGVPFTNYMIQVEENIKGCLITENPVEITKEGGVSFDRTSVIVFENDEMPQPGETYIFRAFAQMDGSLLVSGPQSNVLLDQYEISMQSDEDAYSLVVQYVDAYNNEINPNIRESAVSVYDAAE